MPTAKGAKRNVTAVGRAKRPKRGARLSAGLGKPARQRRDNKHVELDNKRVGGSKPDADGGQQLDQQQQHDSVAVERDGGDSLHSPEQDHDLGRADDGSVGAAALQAEIGFATYSVDRMEEVLYNAEPKWHLREVLSVLVDDMWDDGCYPAHDDLDTIGKVMRAGADQLSIRFREVDPEIWQWLIQALEAKCPSKSPALTAGI